MMDMELEVIKRIFINLKNYSSWDYSDFRITKEEGEFLLEVLKRYIKEMEA